VQYNIVLQQRLEFAEQKWPVVRVQRNSWSKPSVAGPVVSTEKLLAEVHSSRIQTESSDSDLT
jgi:hypothetical protein